MFLTKERREVLGFKRVFCDQCWASGAALLRFPRSAPGRPQCHSSGSEPGRPLLGSSAAWRRAVKQRGLRGADLNVVCWPLVSVCCLLLMSVTSVIWAWEEVSPWLGGLPEQGHSLRPPCLGQGGQQGWSRKVPAAAGSSCTGTPGPSACQRPDTARRPGPSALLLLRPLCLPGPRWGHAGGPAGQPMPARRAASRP